MHIRTLKTAILLAEFQSFRKVAEALNVTQAAVSSRIFALEQDLGVKLFDRDSKGAKTTERGQEFILGAIEILKNFEVLTSKISEDRDHAGEVRIGFVSSMASTLLPLVATEMRLKFERVRFTIHSDIGANLESLLRKRELDIALVAEDRIFKNYGSARLCSFGARWMASPLLLETYDIDESPIDDETFLRLPIVAYEAGTTGHEKLMTVVSKDEIDRIEVHHSNSLPTSIDMARAGIGIASIPPVVVQRQLKEGTLRILNTTRHLPSITFCAVTLPDASGPLSAAMVSLMRDAATRFCADFEDSIAKSS